VSPLDQQIKRAHRRLAANVLWQQLALAILITAALWALTIIGVRLFGLDIQLGHGAWIAALAAVALALVRTAFARPTMLHAAIALDGAAGLKERLSTAFVIRRDNDPFARAAVRDAESKAGRVHVPSHLHHRLPAVWPWSAATVCVALLLLWLMPTFENLFADDRKPTELIPREEVLAEREAIQTEYEDLLNRTKELVQGNPQLARAVEDVKPLDMPDAPTSTPEDIRREAVKSIDDVRERLQRDMDSVGDDHLKALRNFLDKLEQPDSQQASSELAKSLSEGNFDRAKQALRDMKQQLEESAKNTKDPESKQKLEQMQQQLNQLAKQINKLSDSVHVQKALENKAGLSAEAAKKLTEQLSKMDPKQLQKELQKQLGGKGMTQEQIQQLAKKIQQNKQTQQTLQQLAKSLSKAAQGCQQCSGPSSSGSGAARASDAISNAMSQLSDLEMSEQMLNELQAQLSDWNQLRDSVCQGGMCPGKGQGDRRGIGLQGPNPGLGFGSRIGKERTPYQRDPTKAKTRYTGGVVIGTMLVDGPQVRGEATAEAIGTAEAEVRDALDAVEREDIPQQYQRVLREYFEHLAGLMREKQAAAEKPASDETP